MLCPVCEVLRINDEFTAPIVTVRCAHVRIELTTFSGSALRLTIQVAIGRPMDGGAKIRIKVGPMEVEYEGEPSFLKDGLEGLLAKMAELSMQLPPGPETVASEGNGTAQPTATNGHDLSTSTIAAHFEAKSATELAVCALAKLELTDSKAGVKRTDIIEEMKSAKVFYNPNMGSNLSSSLKTLTTKKRVHQGASET